MRGLLLAAVLALGLPACTSLRAPVDPGAMAPVGEEEKEEGASALSIGHTILMYLPNRILDLFDMVRAGVNVGPGIGFQLKATDFAQVSFMSRLSAGLGLQSLRHLPAYAAAESGVALGPVDASGNLGIGWYQSKTDIRVEAHVAIVGAHAAVDPVQILDFILGFFTVDISDDDY